jgi:ZIP family zinc transporter
MDVLVLTLAGIGTALATGLGAIPVSRLGARTEQLRPALWGLTIGLMGAASVLGLIIPALDDGAPLTVGLGVLAGCGFLLISRRLLSERDVHVAGIAGSGARRSVLVFAVLFVHSLPEGFAIGTAYGSETAGLGLYVILAIALQNIPEGTSVAIPMDAAGFTRWQQFGAAVLTSAPQPIGALIAYALVTQVNALLPASFGFAAGAMLALVAVELAPQAFTASGRALAALGTVGGAGLMIALALLLGV